MERRSLTTAEAVQQVNQGLDEDEKRQIEEDLLIIHRKIDVENAKIVSTGSTLIDLAISGKRRYGGGLPGGIIIELYGPSGAGKTALLAELCGSAQKRGGEVGFDDPEARLDQEYSRIYGVSVSTDFFDYHRPNTVSEMFDCIYGWKPKNPDVVNVRAADSIAALSTNLEMAEGDKMSMRRAKEFSEGLRKTCRMIANKNWLVAFTNQVRQGGTMGGEVTPGGMGIPFYASLRLRVAPAFQKSKILKKVSFTINGHTGEEERVIGINSTVRITKSSIDEPFREAPFSIIFGYGVDDIRANLQYLKDKLGGKSYDAFTKSFVSLDQAVDHIEQSGTETKLREKTIDTWNEIEKQTRIQRKPKKR